MKNFTIAFLLFIGFAFSATAQQTQAIKVGPLGFLLGNYNLRYERALGSNSSLQLGANYYDYKIFDEKVSGFGIAAGYRYYFKEALRGPYVSPALTYSFNETLGYKYSDLGVDATIGYQWVTGGGFVIDLGLGYGRRFEVSKDDDLINDYNRGGVRFTFALGYAF